MLSVSPTSASERCGLRRPARGLAVGAGAVVRVVVVALGVVTGWSRCPGSRGGVVVAVVLVVGVRFWGLRLAIGFGSCGVTWGGRGAATTSGVAALAAARREQWVQLLEQAAPGPWRPAEPTQRWPRCWIGCGAEGACHPVCRRYGLVGVSAPARVAVEQVVVAAVVVVDAVLAVEVTEVEEGEEVGCPWVVGVACVRTRFVGVSAVPRWCGVCGVGMACMAARPLRVTMQAAAALALLSFMYGMRCSVAVVDVAGKQVPVAMVVEVVVAARSSCPAVAAGTRGAAMAVHVEGEEVGEVEVQGSGSSPS